MDCSTSTPVAELHRHLATPSTSTSTALPHAVQNPFRQADDVHFHDAWQAASLVQLTPHDAFAVDQDALARAGMTAAANWTWSDTTTPIPEEDEEAALETAKRRLDHLLHTMQ
jgi:hypothetical protein